MLESPIPPHDDKRVESLRKLQMLDTPIEERFEKITRMGKRTLGIPIVAFTLVDKDRQTFKSVQGMEPGDVGRNVTICGHVVAGDEMLVVPDTRKDKRFSDNPLINSDPGIGFYAGCPVRAPDGEKIGVFCAIDSQARELNEEQVQFMQDLASMIEVELRSAMLSKAQSELLEELSAAQRSALIDPVTRLWNKSGMAEALQREWDHAVADEMSLAIAVAGVDDFNSINEIHGPTVGNEVLKYVGQQFLGQLRSTDTLGRMEGKGFLFVLPKCQTNHLKHILDNMRKFFADTPVPTSAGYISITLSFGGLSIVPNKKSSLDHFIDLADQALQTAKDNGRNCVKISPATEF